MMPIGGDKMSSLKAAILFLFQFQFWFEEAGAYLKKANGVEYLIKG